MRALDRGEDFIVTRNGTAVGELRPLRRRQFVTTDEPSRPPSQSISIGAGPISTCWSIKTRLRAVDLPADRGLIDTSLAVVLGTLAGDRLPSEIAISAPTLAELASGPHGARDEFERSRRQAHLQQIEASFQPLSFDAACARSFGPVYAAVAFAGRKPRGPREPERASNRNLIPLRSEREVKPLSLVDLMIAATALAHQVPLFTRNAQDRRGLDDPLEIIDLSS